MTPLLPSYKPVVRLETKTLNDPFPDKLPFMKDNRIYLFAGTSDKDYLADSMKYKAWSTNKIKGPDTWWLTWISTGWHDNVKKVQELCNKKAPDSVVALYHPTWQFRFALGKSDKLLLENAKFDWQFFWAKESGAVGTRMN
jgi:hypothetical protein